VIYISWNTTILFNLEILFYAICYLQARERGIIDDAAGEFLNTKTGERIALSDAVDACQVHAEFHHDAASASDGPGSAHCDSKTYAVSGVVDQVYTL
jgi:hypothetical protein